MSSVTTSGTTRSAFSFSRIWDQFGMLVVFAVLFIGCVIFVPNFASFINMKGLGLAISMSGMVACGMLFCLASGDFDLSVASVIACAGVTTAVVINLTESMWVGIGAGLLLGALSGLVNGFVIARLKINALITTLATMRSSAVWPISSLTVKRLGLKTSVSLPSATPTGLACQRLSG